MPLRQLMTLGIAAHLGLGDYRPHRPGPKPPPHHNTRYIWRVSACAYIGNIFDMLGMIYFFFESAAGTDERNCQAVCN